MAFSVNVAIRDNASPTLSRLGDGIRRPDVRKVMGRAIATALRTHFSKLDSERANRMGGRRTHFYGQVRRSVQQPELVGGDGVKVSINHVGIAQRYFGGDIEPVNAEWLPVAARTEAYGRRPREFNDLSFVLFRAAGPKPLAALVQNEQTSLGGRVQGSITPGGRRKGETIGGGIFYWLVKRVTQKPDPSVLPTDAKLESAAIAAADEYYNTLLEREADQ